LPARFRWHVYSFGIAGGDFRVFKDCLPGCAHDPSRRPYLPIHLLCCLLPYSLSKLDFIQSGSVAERIGEAFEERAWDLYEVVVVVGQ